MPERFGFSVTFKMTDALVVFSACANEDDAARLGRVLVEKGLAACANILPGMRSIYRWKGAVHDEREVLLLLKTTSARFDALRDTLRSEHPYELPEILAIPVTEGLSEYLGWLAQ